MSPRTAREPDEDPKDDDAAADDLSERLTPEETVIVQEYLNEDIEKINTVVAITDGLEYLRAIDRDPMRLWTSKAPKGGGTIHCVLCQDTNEVVLVHQRANRFTIYSRAG